jgi:hypothetical protein
MTFLANGNFFKKLKRNFFSLRINIKPKNIFNTDNEYRVLIKPKYYHKTFHLFYVDPNNNDNEYISLSKVAERYGKYDEKLDVVNLM